MRKLSLVLALVVGLFGFSSTADAGIVDIFLDSGTGAISIRTDVGLDIIAIGMVFHGAAGGSVNWLALSQPFPNVDPVTSTPVQFDLAGNRVAQANPPGVVGSFINTNGATIQIGTLSNPGSVTAFDCVGCLSLLGGGVVLQGFVDITDMSDYIIIPEPAAIALLGLGLAGLAFVRRSAA